MKQREGFSWHFFCLWRLSANAYKLGITDVCVLRMKVHAVAQLSHTLESWLVFPAHSSELAKAQVFVWKQFLILPNMGQRAATGNSDPATLFLFKAKPCFPVVCSLPSHLRRLNCLSVPLVSWEPPVQLRSELWMSKCLILYRCAAVSAGSKAWL